MWEWLEDRRGQSEARKSYGTPQLSPPYSKRYRLAIELSPYDTE